MKNKIFNLVILTILFTFLAGAQAQDDYNNKDNEGKKDKSDRANVHFTVDKKSIPKYVEPGQTFRISVDVKNKSRNTNWYSGNLKFNVESPFTFVGSTLSTFTFAPGEYGTIYVDVRAPNSEGKQLLKLVVYDNDRKSRQFVKNITVGTNSTLNKESPSDGDVTKNKDNEKNKEKNNEKNKEKNNEKNKEKNNEKNKEKNNESDR